MRASRKYLVAVALLAVLAVIFGLAGTVAPLPEPISSQQELSSSSDSVTHFINPPTFDSEWVDITDKLGQSLTLTHNLNTTEVLVDVVGRQSLTDEDHKLFFGLTAYVPEWNKTYDEFSDYAHSLVQTSDGGYAIAGGTEKYGTDFWLVKTDATGNHQWNKTYGGAGEANHDRAHSVVQTSDGGYALAGYTNSYGAGESDFWLVKTDVAGNALWNKTYGYEKYDSAYSLVQTDDGGYALAGYTYPSAVDSDFWLVKTDSSGNALWNKTYGDAEYDHAYSLVQTSDGGYAIAGETASYGAGSYDFWLVKTDSAGNTLWNRTYGGVESDLTYSLVQTADGGYALAGYTHSFGAGNADFWLVKTDAGGNMLWNRTYGGTDDDSALSVVQTSDGGYATAGSTRSYGAGHLDFWLVKTDSSGNMQWNKTYGGAQDDYARALVQSSDGGYAMAGYTNSFYGAGLGNFWLVKTGVEYGLSMGLSMAEFTDSTITLYRGRMDPFWNFVRVRIWVVKEPTWQFGDINQDGVVDAQDLYIVSKNYGKTFSALSLTGIIAIAGIHTYKKRKQQK